MSPGTYHEYMTPQEVAALLRISIQTVYRWTRQRKLPGFKVGRAIRFERADIERRFQPRGRAQGDLADDGGGQ